VATVAQIMDALAAQIETAIGGTASPDVPFLQVEPRLVPNPTPPAVDIYPGDPFQDAAGFGRGNNDMWLTVRVRVSPVESEGGQDLLLSMMDPEAATSMAQAILGNRTLGGVVERVATVEGPTAYGVFPDPGGGGNLLGCTWRVRIVP